MISWRIDEILDKQEWRNALALVKKFDFYHTWDFHAISKNNGEGEPILYKIYRPDKAAGLLVPLLSRDIIHSDYKDLTSVYGYPSPLVYGCLSNEEISSIWTFFCYYLFQNKYISLFSRLHPLFTPKIIIDTHGVNFGKIVVIDLSLSEEEQRKSYRKGHRYDIVNLEKKNVYCYRLNNNISLDCFIDNYEATMRSLGACKMYFFSKSYYQSMLNASDFKSYIYSCKYNNIIICSGLFIFCNGIVQYHLSGTNQEYYELAGTKMMIDKVRRDAVVEGQKYFILGGGVGSKEDSLFKFKSGFSKKTENFNVIKLILNQPIYDILVSKMNDKGTYFPLYRGK